MVLDEGVIVEIVRPGTGDPVPEGEVGEVVVTTLNPDYPLIRFGTGDLSALLPGRCPTGRTNTRIKGWLGPRRPDHQGARHVRAPGAGGRDRAPPPGGAAGRGWWSAARWPTTRMTLKRRGRRRAPTAWPTRIGETIRDVTKLRGEVELVRSRAACPTTAR